MAAENADWVVVAAGVAFVLAAPNEKVAVGTGILLGSGRFPAFGTIPKLGTPIGADDVVVVVADCCCCGDLGNENIPGIAVLVATGIDDAGAGAAAEVAIGVMPDNVGIAAPNWNPGDAAVVVVAIGLIAAAVDAAASFVLLNVNIAAVGALNPVFSAVVDVVVVIDGPADDDEDKDDVVVDAVIVVNDDFDTLSSAVGCAINGCGSTAGFVICTPPVTWIGFDVSGVAITLGRIVDTVSVGFGALKLIPVMVVGAFTVSTTSLGCSTSSSSLSSKSPAKHFSIMANLFFSTFRFSSSPVANWGLPSCGFTNGFFPYASSS